MLKQYIFAQHWNAPYLGTHGWNWRRAGVVATGEAGRRAQCAMKERTEERKKGEKRAKRKRVGIKV